MSMSSLKMIIINSLIEYEKLNNKCLHEILSWIVQLKQDPNLTTT